MSTYEATSKATRPNRFTALSRFVRNRERAATQVLPNPSAAATFPYAQSVLDAVCNLRAVDDAYGIGDAYFGQPLPPLYRELPELSAGEILETVVHLLALGYLRSSRHNPSLVWVTNQGWLHWTSWDSRNEFLLRHESSGE